jgi:hypothetical protein
VLPLLANKSIFTLPASDLPDKLFPNCRSLNESIMILLMWHFAGKLGKGLSQPNQDVLIQYTTAVKYLVS